jgi:hypothetical protein
LNHSGCSMNRKSLAPARNWTMIPCLSIPQPSHYSDYNILAPHDRRVFLVHVSHNNVVSRVTRLCVQGTLFQFPIGARNVSVLQGIHTGSWAKLASYSMDTEQPFTSGEDDHSIWHNGEEWVELCFHFPISLIAHTHRKLYVYLHDTCFKVKKKCYCILQDTL